MSSRYRRRRRRKAQLRQPDVTQSPTLSQNAREGSGQHATVEAFAYDENRFVEKTVTDMEQVKELINEWPITWINVEGTADVETVVQATSLFKLHELAVEDIVNLHQRAKVEEYNGLLFIIMRMATWAEDHTIQEQLCIVLSKNVVATFQEDPGGDSLGPVRERIRKSQAQIRTHGTDWLMYSMIDAVVDGYFPVLEKLGEALEQLEDDILEKFDRSTPARILELKREILGVRRSIWPAREAINTLIRNDNPQITEHTKVYLRDCYDHVVRIIDLVETQREMCSDLMDLYLSSASNRMNEVMKVLTMITLLFMPPTLVAGIYGMNFDTNVSRWNMPELDWHYGYFFALALMAGSMITVYGLVQWRGWLQDDFPANVDPNNPNQI